MTEITAPKSPVTAEQFADEIREQLKYTQNVTTEQATPADVYVAASKAVRNHLADSWFKTQADTVNGNTKAVGYLSAEFLMGKQLRNALLNAGLTEQFDKAVEEGTLDYVVGTNLTYRKPELLNRDWYVDVDVSKYAAYFIVALNHDMSVSSIIDPLKKIENLLANRK